MGVVAGIAEMRVYDTPYFDYNDVLRVLLDTRDSLVIGMYQVCIYRTVPL